MGFGNLQREEFIFQALSLPLFKNQVIFYATTTTFHHTHAIPVVGHHLVVDTNNLPLPSIPLPTRTTQFSRHNQNKTTTTTPTKKTQQSESPLPQNCTTTTTTDPPPPPPEITIIATTTSIVTESPPPPNSQTNTTHIPHQSIHNHRRHFHDHHRYLTIANQHHNHHHPKANNKQPPLWQIINCRSKKERDNTLTPKNPKSTPRAGTNHHLPSFALVALTVVPESAAGIATTEPQPTASNIATAENRGGTHSDGRITTALTFASPREGGDRAGEEVLLTAVATGD
ncbi:Hypothetical predicted protein [Olea europaea subsp. europaea]|uniref:Uncharacterized protein n=1 Tax=Olea europaea subsp. europaea TaxID=158383 RepID=A0A8S0P993_OLEEU|nr:Hypothetical predicted protein [Olea europaea subsp. europaea]